MREPEEFMKKVSLVFFATAVFGFALAEYASAANNDQLMLVSFVAIIMAVPLTFATAMLALFIE